MCDASTKVSVDIGGSNPQEVIKQLKALTRAARDATRAITALKEAQEAPVSTASLVAQEVHNGRRGST
ncbi:hypothetical protein LCGC14_0648090 [marine sediment metagenome]|uniref:Uncharacterized protein n=1 Tax=marine sediment metagenome TaxID=412755 RepID=A0A0F9TIW2_9ZZZZ